MLLSEEARAYRVACDVAVASQWRGGPLVGKVAIRAEFFMDLRGDLDNRCKQLGDSIQGRILANDSQIWEWHLIRRLDRVSPRVELEITSYRDPERKVARVKRSVQVVEHGEIAKRVPGKRPCNVLPRILDVSEKLLFRDGPLW